MRGCWSEWQNIVLGRVMSGFDKWELYNGLITPSSEYSEELKHGIMEIQHFLSSYCSIKPIVARFATEKYTNALGISPLSLKVAETNKIFYHYILMRGEPLTEF